MFKMVLWNKIANRPATLRECEDLDRAELLNVFYTSKGAVLTIEVDDEAFEVRATSTWDSSEKEQ